MKKKLIVAAALCAVSSLAFAHGGGGGGGWGGGGWGGGGGDPAPTSGFAGVIVGNVDSTSMGAAAAGTYVLGTGISVQKIHSATAGNSWVSGDISPDGLNVSSGNTQWAKSVSIGYTSPGQKLVNEEGQFMNGTGGVAQTATNAWIAGNFATAEFGGFGGMGDIPPITVYRPVQPVAGGSE